MRDPSSRSFAFKAGLLVLLIVVGLPSAVVYGKRPAPVEVPAENDDTDRRLARVYCESTVEADVGVNNAPTFGGVNMVRLSGTHANAYGVTGTVFWLLRGESRQSRFACVSMPEEARVSAAVSSFEDSEYLRLQGMIAQMRAK